MFLLPKVAELPEGITDFAFDIRRPRGTFVGQPLEIYALYVLEDLVYKAVSAENEYTYWDIQEQIELGKAVAIAFDGRWERNQFGFWQLNTFNEPQIFWVGLDGKLFTRAWAESSTEIELASDVVKVRAIRSWKNVHFKTLDTGLIAAYLKTDGKIYYRSYCEQEDGTFVWELEKQAEQFEDVKDFGLFITNDYRTGFVVEESGNKVRWCVTERNWAGMAIRNHTIIAQPAGLLTDLKEVQYEECESADHAVSTTVDGMQTLFCPAVWPKVVSISNPGPEDAETILIEFNMKVVGDLVGLEGLFTQDSDTDFAILATAKEAENIIKLTTTNFGGASGDITISYTSPGETGDGIYSIVDGGCIMDLASFSISFTPNIKPPEAYTVHSISADVILDVDFVFVTYDDVFSEQHNVSAAPTDLQSILIHIDDIIP